MKRNTVAAWIGVSILVGTGIGVLVRAQTGVGASARILREFTLIVMRAR